MGGRIAVPYLCAPMLSMNSLGRGRGGLGVAACWSTSPEDATSTVRRMLVAAPHRGTVTRVVSTSAGSVGISGDDGVQGVASSDGWLLAYAGIVDNPEQFGADPSAGGDATATALLSRVRSTPSTTVAAQLRGLHAIAVVGPDGITYWRDHLGYASLFHRRSNGRVWIGSEAKQVVAGAGLVREPNLDVVTQLFFGTAADDTPSAFVGVERVPRRRVVATNGAGLREDAFWEPRDLLESSSMGKDEYAEAFGVLMDQAVRRMMRGPDFVSLSGGVDSPVVAAFAAPAHREMFGTDLVAISSVYPDQPSVDESRYIELVADDLKIPRHARPPVALATDQLERWVTLFDSPFPAVSISESEEFYRWAHSLGCRVLLTGEVAEYLTEMSSHTLGHLLVKGRLGALNRRISRERAVGRGFGFVGKKLVRSVLSDPLVDGLRRLRGTPRRSRTPAWITAVPEAPPRRSDLTRWEAEQLGFFGGSGILLDAHDAITALTRVDVRRPFSDIDLWEATLRLRAEVKHADPRWKGLLRDVVRGRVPDPILDRRDKTVFDANLMANIDYAALERWLASPRHQLPGIDYGLVAQAIAGRSLDLLEFMWMKDLAAAHAFLDQW